MVSVRAPRRVASHREPSARAREGGRQFRRFRRAREGGGGFGGGGGGVGVGGFVAAARFR